MSNTTKPPQEKQQLILFTDLDGTLLDHHSYSAAAAAPALSELERLHIPWIPNTSKTFAELQPLRQSLGHSGSFVVENGAAIYLPADFSCEETLEMDSGYQVKRFGQRRDDLLAALNPLHSRYRFHNFAQMSVQQLSELTGLNELESSAALQRKYTEPMLWRDTEAALVDMRLELKSQGLSLVRGGRFVHLMGQHDKADALSWLKLQYENRGISAVTVALGDGENDIEMLNAANISVVIRSPVHPLIQLAKSKTVRVSTAIGPEGWNQEVLQILSEYNRDSAIER